MYIKAVKSGNLLEVYEFDYPPSQLGRVAPTRSRIKRLPRPRTETNIRHCRNSFKRLVRANISTENPPGLLTLTMREVVEVGQAFKFYTAFCSRLRRRFGKSLSWVAVPEFQKRGAVHFHILIWNLPHDIAAKERKKRVLAELWGHGFVDIKKTDGSPRLSGYLAKYMAKAMHDERLVGKRAYSASRNVLRSSVLNSSWPFALDLAFDEWGFKPGDNSPDESKEYDTVFLGRCLYKQYLLPS